MKSKCFASILAFSIAISAFCQKSTMELSFTGNEKIQMIQLDSILIENITLYRDTTLYSPDTILVIDYISGINDGKPYASSSFSVSQNYPNPFTGKTIINLNLGEKQPIIITVRDLLGRNLAQYENTLNHGNHSFTFYPSSEKFYFLTVRGIHSSKSIKMLNLNENRKNSGDCKIDYNNTNNNTIESKASGAQSKFVFKIGDILRYTGFAKTEDYILGSDVIEDSPATNKSYTFNITKGIPCSGIPTVSYEGQVYNTVQIGHQCWLKENLNVGTYITTVNYQFNNGSFEKYCYENNQANCITYGGLYQWEEMMNYSTIEGARGICPLGWHIPTDFEWKILEGTVDSLYHAGNPEWDGIENWRGFDAGRKLKSDNGWYNDEGGNNYFGFTALPGGFAGSSLVFMNLTKTGRWWTSRTEYGANPRARALMYGNDLIYRDINAFSDAYSVRCIKD